MAGIAKLQLLIDIKEKLNVGLNAAKQKVAKATGDIQKKLDTIGTNTIKAFDGIKSQVPYVGDAIGLLSNPYAAAAAAALALASGIGLATTKAIEWRDQMAQVNTTARLGQKELNGLSDKILNIAGSNTNKIDEVPLAFNRIISAGLDTNTALATLEPTLRAAKAGFTDVETAAAAATSVMMAAGVDANKTFDVLFATQRAGNAEFKDIAMYLPKVIPLAKNVGFAFEETAGAYAKLTGTLRPEAASTALEGIYRAFSDPNKAIGQVSKKTGKYITGFKSIGVDVFDSVTGKARPLISILNDVSKSMQGLSDKQKMLKFSKLGLDQEAALGFSTLLQNLPETKRIIGEVTNSQGEANRAFKAAKSPLDDWKIIMNKVQVAIIKIGQYFIPFVEIAGQKVLAFIQYWKDLYTNSAAFRDLLSAIGVVFQVAFNISTLGIRLLINGYKTIYGLISVIIGKIGEWTSKIFGLQGGWTELYNNVRPFLIYIKQLLSEIGGLMYSVFTLDFEDAKKRIQSFKMPDFDKIKANSALSTGKPITIYIPNDHKKKEKGTNGDTNTIVTNTGGGSGKSGIAADAQAVKGGSQTKNITINIDSFIKGGLNPTHTSINSMSKDELERWLTEMFFRVIRSAETSS